MSIRHKKNIITFVLISSMSWLLQNTNWSGMSVSSKWSWANEQWSSRRRGESDMCHVTYTWNQRMCSCFPYMLFWKSYPYFVTWEIERGGIRVRVFRAWSCYPDRPMLWPQFSHKINENSRENRGQNIGTTEWHVMHRLCERNPYLTRISRRIFNWSII